MLYGFFFVSVNKSKITLTKCANNAISLVFAYLWYSLIDFAQTFLAVASGEKDEVVTFWGQEVEG